MKDGLINMSYVVLAFAAGFYVSPWAFPLVLVAAGLGYWDAEQSHDCEGLR